MANYVDQTSTRTFVALTKLCNTSLSLGKLPSEWKSGFQQSIRTVVARKQGTTDL